MPAIHTHAAAPARGVTTVTSAKGPECHAASYYCAKCVNGTRRNALNIMMLTYWLAMGAARKSCPRSNACPEYRNNGRCALGWHGLDVVNESQFGLWLPFATRETVQRADRIEFSHVIPAYSGAYCPCCILPETGARNASRPAGVAIPKTALTGMAAELLTSWPDYWRQHVARPASLARLS